MMVYPFPINTATPMKGRPVTIKGQEMKTLTYSETSAFFKELDQAVKMRETITILVQEDARVGSALWTRLRKCKGFMDAIKNGGPFQAAMLAITGVEDFLTLVSMLGGFFTFLAYGTYKNYRMDIEEGPGPFRFTIRMETLIP